MVDHPSSPRLPSNDGGARILGQVGADHRDEIHHPTVAPCGTGERTPANHVLLEDCSPSFTDLLSTVYGENRRQYAGTICRAWRRACRFESNERGRRARIRGIVIRKKEERKKKEEEEEDDRTVIRGDNEVKSELNELNNQRGIYHLM